MLSAQSQTILYIQGVILLIDLINTQVYAQITVIPLDKFNIELISILFSISPYGRETELQVDLDKKFILFDIRDEFYILPKSLYLLSVCMRNYQSCYSDIVIANINQ